MLYYTWYITFEVILYFNNLNYLLYDKSHVLKYVTDITWTHLMYFRTNFISDKIHTEVKAEYDTVLSAASPPSSGAASDAPSGWESWLPRWSPLPHYPVFTRTDRDKIDTLLDLVGLHGPHFQRKMIDFSNPDDLHLNKAWPRLVPQWFLA